MWSLYHEDKFLEPLCFSNGKSQKDVVKEVLDAIEEGHKVIFIHGVCGTGKSAIALNIARKLGRASVVVPGKNLQAQYKKDYEESKYLLKEDGSKMKISVMTGRNNHRCKFLEDESIVPQKKHEVDSKLHDIFSGVRERILNKKKMDASAANNIIPCKIEIKEKNWGRIKDYIRQNKDVHLRDFLDLKDVKRASIAGACPYWCPVIPEKYELKGKSFESAIKKTYEGLEKTNFIFYQRKKGCPFYEQFNAYINSDVIVFNSMKYLLESVMNRKPSTEVEIIDECDEFLDNFSNQRDINLNRFQRALASLFVTSKESEKIVDEIAEIVVHLKKDTRFMNAIGTEEIIPLKETGLYDLFKIFLKNKEFMDEADDESYLFDVEETSMMFENFLEESYVIFSKRDEDVIASVVTTNLAKRFKNLVDKNKIVVLMSGTLHSSNVLRDIFGLEDFKIVDAETEQQGEIEVKKTGAEMDCRYSNFSSGQSTREGYLRALSKCLEKAEKPSVVHINSFADLPSEEEIERFGIDNLITKEKLVELQNEDKTGKLIERFKAGKVDVLFSTRAGRGMDFPGDQCKSIIFTKYPNPNIKDPFWKILNQTQPQHYWEFYRDKARRELWQKIYRGLRFKGDHVYVLSPDTRVLEAFDN